jgi:hypothetical protein
MAEKALHPSLEDLDDDRTGGILLAVVVVDEPLAFLTSCQVRSFESQQIACKDFLRMRAARPFLRQMRH